MSKLSTLGNSSNEAREQRIMKLRNDFSNGTLVTVASVREKLGYAESTIISWAKSGNIPLIKSDGTSVVPLTDENAPKWIEHK